jgi:hypothetical protein
MKRFSFVLTLSGAPADRHRDALVRLPYPRDDIDARLDLKGS